MSDETLSFAPAVIDLNLPLFKTVSPRTIPLRAKLEVVINQLVDRSNMPSGAPIMLYCATTRFALWEIKLSRQGPLVHSPNCLLLAERVDDNATDFTLVPFRHTFPDLNSQLAWSWCSNLFLSWRWLDYMQLQPFLLNETGRFQYTSDAELEAFLQTPPMDEAEFKERRRRNYAGLHVDAQLEEQINREWEFSQAQLKHAVEQAQAELAIRGAGERLSFEEAAQSLMGALRRTAGDL